MAYVPYDPRNPLRRMPGYGAPPAAPTQPSGGWDITPEIQQQVFGIINPQLQSAADIINRRGQMGTGAITGLTNAWQQNLQGIGGMLGGWGQDELKGAAGFGRDLLTGAGKQQAASLGTALQQIGPGIKGPGDVNLAQQGKGAGGAAYGTGIAELDALIAKQAAAQTRSALEPSFAAMTGQQQQGQLAGQLARQLYEQQSTIMGRVPELINTLQQNAYVRAADQRDYAEKVREFNVGLKSDKLTNLAKLKESNEASTGYQWEITSTGVRPRLVNGKRVPTTSAQTANRNQQISIILSTGLDPTTGALTPTAAKQLKALGVMTGGGVSGTLVGTNVRAAASQQAAETRATATVAAAMTRANAAAKAAGLVAAQPNVSASRAAGVWLDKAGRPIAAMNDNPAIKAPPPPTKITYKKMPAPHRVGEGKWRTATGVPLSDNSAKFWENQFQKGYTDGKGKLTSGTPAQVKTNTGQEGGGKGGSDTYKIGTRRAKDGRYYPKGTTPPPGGGWAAK